MCKYCESSISTSPSSICSEYLSSRIKVAFMCPEDEEMLFVLDETASEVIEKGDVFMAVFYCPMCGRKLKKDSNE